jgi:hypothetical protein
MRELNLPTYTFKITTKEQKKYIFDAFRKKFVLLTPEEWVRQNFLQYLIREKGYSSNLLQVEMGFKLGQQSYRADIIAFDRSGRSLLVVECKAPEVKIGQKQFDQIARYNFEWKVPYLIVTNGLQHFCCYMNYQEKKYTFLKEVPDFKSITPE